MFSIVDLPGHRNRLARGDANKPGERPRKAWMDAANYPGGGTMPPNRPQLVNAAPQRFYRVNNQMGEEYSALTARTSENQAIRGRACLVH